MAFWMRLRSPPGSITAARFVASHHSKVQFCWKGVTGIIAARALCIRKTSSPKVVPDLEPIDPEHKRIDAAADFQHLSRPKAVEGQKTCAVQCHHTKGMMLTADARVGSVARGLANLSPEMIGCGTDLVRGSKGPRATEGLVGRFARSRDRLVMACTTSMLSLPRKLRRRSMRQTWRRPGHWLREEARLSLHSRRRISMRPCPFSTVSTRATSGAGAHSAEGGIRPEGQGDVGFQRRLVALDREEVIAAALDDEATEVGLGEDRIAADDRTLDGKRLEQGQSRRDLVGLRRHPQLPDDTLQPFAERGQQMHSGPIADSAAPQPLAVNRHMSGCARALHPSPEEPFQRAHIQRPEKLAPHRRRRHATAQNSKFRQGLPAQLAAPAHAPQLIRPPGQHRRQRNHQKTRKRIALALRPPMVRDHAEHLPKIRPSRPIAARHSRPPSPVAESMNRADPDANPQNRIALSYNGSTETGSAASSRVSNVCGKRKRRPSKAKESTSGASRLR